MPTPTKKRIKKEPTEPIGEQKKMVESLARQELTGEQCLKIYLECQKIDVFKKKVTKSERNRFLTKICEFKKPIQCLNCGREYMSGRGINVHLENCKEIGKDSEDDDEEEEEEEEVELPAPPSPSPLPSLPSTTELKPINVEGRAAMKRGRPKNNEFETATWQEFESNPFLWLRVPTRQQEAVIQRICKSKNFKCFRKNCKISFNTAEDLINHLADCVGSEYSTYKDRREDFRKLEKTERSFILRKALALKPSGVQCLFCDRVFSHHYGLFYHIERCQLEKKDQPWQCWRCKFKGNQTESEQHLESCARMTPTKKSDESEEKSQDVTIGSGMRRKVREDGTVRLSYRKSAMVTDMSGVFNKKEQQFYQNQCMKRFEEWCSESENQKLSARLERHLNTNENNDEIPPHHTFLKHDDPLYEVLCRKSVTLNTGKPPPLSSNQTSLPSEGVRIDAMSSEGRQFGDKENHDVAYFGAPINQIRVAPNRMSNGKDDVILVTTFPSEVNFDADSSIIHFWRHDQTKLRLWFRLHLINKGVVLSAEWLKIPQKTRRGFIGFVALATTFGEVLIYKIDEKLVESATEVKEVPRSSSKHEVAVIVAEPVLTLRQPKTSSSSPSESSAEAGAAADTGDEIVEDGMNENDETLTPFKHIPMIRIAWNSNNGGNDLIGVNACGALVHWKLDDDADVTQPKVILDSSWDAPAWDVGFLNEENIVVSFRDRTIKIINVTDWSTRLSDSTIKTVGQRVHIDTRIFNDFFTFQTEYLGFPHSLSTGISYFRMLNDDDTFIIVPITISHQLITWGVAVCPTRGIIVTCGADGRLLASANGRYPVKNAGNDLSSYAGQATWLTLTRRRIEENQHEVDEILNKLDTSLTSSDAPTKKRPIEETLNDHDEIVKKMWIDVEFGPSTLNRKVQQTCRDQRVESLNCVDTTTDAEKPFAFTGGEAGLLFAMPCELKL